MSIEKTMTVTVTATSPLTVKADGADTANPAIAAAGLSLTVNDRVTILCRDPILPLIQSIEVEA